jgi:hypothetical protein
MRSSLGLTPSSASPIGDHGELGLAATKDDPAKCEVAARPRSIGQVQPLSPGVNVRSDDAGEARVAPRTALPTAAPAHGLGIVAHQMCSRIDDPRQASLPPLVCERSEHVHLDLPFRLAGRRPRVRRRCEREREYQHRWHDHSLLHALLYRPLGRPTLGAGAQKPAVGPWW